MNSTGQTFSKTSITKYLKNENKKTNRNTISNYTNYMTEALFCKQVRREDILGKKILKTEEKYYLTDHGFHHSLIDDNNNWIPRILENIVFNELIRRNYSVKIGKIKKHEIDFVCKKHDKKVYIQVCYLLATPETIDREFSPLFEVPDKFDTYVLSMDEINLSKNGIKHKNIIDFLLDDEI
ncbi:MAG TPA: ATP-binding protein [Methanosphaera sp.]|nr:ATP-binding protein [Methanosphaera sp.]